MIKTLYLLCAAALTGCATVQLEDDPSYWVRDPQHFATERTRVALDENAGKWCKGAWGCIHRNPTYYEWDYHRTGNTRPSECVAIVDASLPDDLRAAVTEHELCHCRGFAHSGAPRWFVKCPQ